MADYQTQVIWEKGAGMPEEIDNQATVDSFKNKLAAIRSQRYATIQQKDALYDELMGELQSREDLLAMFKSEAIQMYPELAGSNIKSALQAATANHPLKQMWAQYKMRLGPIMSRMNHTFNEFKQKSKEAIDLDDQEIAVVREYEQFASTATTPVPSSSEMVADLISVEGLPSVDETSVIAAVSSLESLDPDAADVIMLQAVNEEEAQAQAELDRAASALMAAQQPGAIKPMHLLIGGAVLAYILFS